MAAKSLTLASVLALYAYGQGVSTTEDIFSENRSQGTGSEILDGYNIEL